MAKFKNILDIINSKKKSKDKISLELTRDDILKICGIGRKDKIFNRNMGYISNWINSYLKYHNPEIRVLLYNEIIYITDSLKVEYDNIHRKYPLGDMYKHKFDFMIKFLGEGDFKSYKNYGISNTIVPECGVYIIEIWNGNNGTVNNGKIIGSSMSMCNRLRQYAVRLPIKLITIHECDGGDHAKRVEEELKKI